MKILVIAENLLQKIYAHGEYTYPEEGAGLMLGLAKKESKRVMAVMPLENYRENIARRNRYLITPQAMLQVEQNADSLSLDVIGVFHSHPDHPHNPSEFDRKWALPWLTYLITSVRGGITVSSGAWQLAEDRSRFHEQAIEVISGVPIREHSLNGTTCWLERGFLVQSSRL